MCMSFPQCSFAEFDKDKNIKECAFKIPENEAKSTRRRCGTLSIGSDRQTSYLRVLLQDKQTIPFLGVCFQKTSSVSILILVWPADHMCREGLDVADKDRDPEEE